MSRFRLNPALVIGSMVNGVMEPTKNEETGTMLRPVAMHQTSAPLKPKLPGCRGAFCRMKAECECDCRRCAYECGERVNSIRREDEGGTKA